jgi:lipopolysaccharide/colanic/teichoic acid biosynthesis glycosyltransferase
MFVHSSESNSRWASKNDDRITWVGKLLRRTRFDEIPQFWNILTGEMSMIGPRPEWTDISEIWSQKISLYPYRHLVKPGLTGWAQINYPYAATEEDVLEKLSYDFYYMKHASALLDLQIILRTISAIMKGAR